MNEELAKKIKDSSYFPELQTYIIDQIQDLNSIDGVKIMTNEKAGEEVKARALAMEKLKDILSPFINNREKKEPTEEDIKKAEKNYAL